MGINADGTPHLADSLPQATAELAKHARSLIETAVRFSTNLTNRQLDSLLDFLCFVARNIKNLRGATLVL